MTRLKYDVLIASMGIDLFEKTDPVFQSAFMTVVSFLFSVAKLNMK